MYCIAGSTFSPASHSSAFALKVSHAHIWSLDFQLNVGGASVELIFPAVSSALEVFSSQKLLFCCV